MHSNAPFGGVPDSMRNNLSKPTRRILQAPLFAGLLLLALALILVLPSVLSAGADLEAKKRLLVLYSGTSHSQAYALINQGIKSTFSFNPDQHIEYFIEYLDLNRNSSPDHQSALLEFYRRKYSGVEFDLVIVISSPALRFAEEHGDELFPLAPVVYTGILPKVLEQISLGSNFTGVLAEVDFAGQLELILQVQPQTRRVVYVTGVSMPDLALLGLFRDAAEPFSDRLEFSYLNHLPLEDIEAEVRGLPPDTVVLLSSFILDPMGRGHVTADVAALLAAASSVPVYICFDSIMVPGVLGGWLFSFEMIGRKAAETGARILQGEVLPPVVSMGYGVNLHKFDWRQLQRWQISEDRLPAGSLVLFRTPSFWELYHRHAIGALILLVLQGGLILFLLIQRKQRRQAELALAQQLEFEKHLAALSARFALSAPGRMDEQIAEAVRLVGETLDVGRVGVFEISEDGLQVFAKHFHTAQDSPPAPRQIDLSRMTWFRGEVMAARTIQFSDLEDLPESAEAEKAYLATQGIRAGVMIPLIVGGAIQGLLTLTTVGSTRKWSPEDIRRFSMIGEIIANSLARKQFETALQQSQKFNRQILDSLSYHIAVLDRKGVVLDVNASWKRHAAKKASPCAEISEFGADYLAVCRQAADDGDSLAQTVLEGVLSVLEGRSPEFTMEYPSHTPDRKQWFIMRVVPFSSRKGGAILSLIENTDRKLAEIDLQKAFTEIESLKNKLEAETAYLREEIQKEHNFEGIIGRSPAIQYVLFKIEQVAATDTTVLILGETGTGKELVSRAIHSNSLRKARPLVKVNCAALPANLIESELFGHERGAFTGAGSRRIGRFELANGGCIFLDEIGELSLELQGKLLRVLQEGELERLGSSVTIRVDVRVIAATNRDLEAQMKMGRFREDLFYRLNVFPITIPPLRERTEDIPLLAQFFLEETAKRMGKRIEFISQSILQQLQEYSWPGNVRELKNVIERAVINSSGPKLHLADKLRREDGDAAGHLLSLQEVERGHILRVLEQTNQRINGPKGAAAILKINPSTLRSRMLKLGIKDT
ncbi:sigma 54-interacting transcriptional regulator [Desulfonatronum thioautotrophicum]|uniref:sigma 54-interacting transcriptional regulator n=1 Tax=Desulfonatronum thioautotrophicum TaxID=617001 RepID=UPI00069ACCAA|nr:sigma 54-interacting transcriptional regulator [Desulfonatronum thioautotrophicum]